MATPKKIGILTAGGDCPGLNAAIRGVGKTAILKYGMEVIGISSGYLGLLEKDYIPLDEASLSGILTLGGTILGTSREKPFKKNHDLANTKPEKIKRNYLEEGFDAIVCIGGNGTMKTAALLAEQGLNVIGIPKTIDNDVYGTEQSFGFDSSLCIATDAIDRLHSTANSHKRIMVIEVMGHHAGWLALYAGIAGGGDVILIPELGYDMKSVNRYLKKRVKSGKPYSIVVVAEGIKKPAKLSAASYIAAKIEDGVGVETRNTILGYIQRGGSPSPMDRILASRYGARAVDLIASEDYGKMVMKSGDNISVIPLSEVGGKLNLVPADHPLIERARGFGVCFGEPGLE
ncbi:MAG: 6-phosphofructokinase [Bacteroidales bacterium]|nr:6-phosphofructokinase [Bacteroidales bacterium]